MGSRNVERDRPSVDERTKLTTYVRDYDDWVLSLACRGCMHTSQLEPRELLRRLGRSARLGDVPFRGLLAIVWPRAEPM